MKIKDMDDRSWRGKALKRMVGNFYRTHFAPIMSPQLRTVMSKVEVNLYRNS